MAAAGPLAIAAAGARDAGGDAGAFAFAGAADGHLLHNKRPNLRFTSSLKGLAVEGFRSWNGVDSCAGAVDLLSEYQAYRSVLWLAKSTATFRLKEMV